MVPEPETLGPTGFRGLGSRVFRVFRVPRV